EYPDAPAVQVPLNDGPRPGAESDRQVQPHTRNPPDGLKDARPGQRAVQQKLRQAYVDWSVGYAANAVAGLAKRRAQAPDVGALRSGLTALRQAERPRRRVVERLIVRRNKGDNLCP